MMQRRMIKHIHPIDGGKELRAVEAVPQCGEDFCDACGDCLHCYEGDPCTETENGQHFWVQYGEDAENADED